MSEARLARLHALRTRNIAERSAIINTVKTEKRGHLTADETKRFTSIAETLKALDGEIADLNEDLARGGNDPEILAERRAGTHDDHKWANRAAKALTAMGGESRAVASGSVDVPTLIDPAVTPKARPARLVDIIVNRGTLDGNAFEYFRQTVRTNNAAPVADLGTKPTSVHTIAPITDRARVIAHLSEAFPIRLFQDATYVTDWLDSEMREGVLDALEAEIISGSGSGEHLTGLLTVAGTTAVAYATDVPTTIRKSVTALQNIGVQPTAWALNPADAEALDLLKEGTGGIGFLLDGVNNGVSNSENVFGSTTIPRIVSPSIPAGVAVLGDWSKLRILVREAMRLDIDAGGTLFDTNAAKMRAEIRVGLAHLRPASFAIADLTP